MIMPQTTDAFVTGVCHDAQLGVAYADVTDAARTLCRNHLCGPAASRMLGDALAAVTLLCLDTEPGTSVLLRITATGPIEGLCVEAMLGDDGIALRGYPVRKVIPELDELETFQPHEILGATARVQIAFTRGNRQLRHANYESRGDISVDSMLMEYYVTSIQRPALIHIASSLYGGYLNFARAFQMTPLPDLHFDEFERLKTRLLDGSVNENLDACLSLPDLCNALELPPPLRLHTTPVRFHCGCSRERVEKLIAGLTLADLRDLLARATPTDIYCHMCGRGYSVPIAHIQHFINQREK